LENNPNEVVTLLFVNVGVPLRLWADAFYQTNADVISYVPPAWKWRGNMRIEDWPTIDAMVRNNKRLVTLLSSGADQQKVDFLLPEWYVFAAEGLSRLVTHICSRKYLFETPFWIADPQDYSCYPSRPRANDGSVPNRLSLVFGTRSNAFDVVHMC
jgi:hypothetical protein